VNIQHLSLGTSHDNHMDMVAEGHHTAKLTNENAKLIRILYASGHFTHEKLGAMFNIGTTAVSRIIRRKSYNHF